MKDNIQNHPDAIKLTSYTTLSGKGSRESYVYCIQKTGMLHEVNAEDGTITGQMYILDISFQKMPEEPTTHDWDEIERRHWINTH